MKKVFLLIIATLFFQIAFSQKTISGVVSDENGDPIIFATIELRCQNKLLVGTESDVSGKYLFKIFNECVEYSIHINYVGYASQEIIVSLKDKETKIDITLKQGVMLDELCEVEVRSILAGKVRGIFAKRKTPNVQSGMEYGYFKDDNEEYQNLQENKFVSPFEEALSTFSIDVDGASYTNTRRFLNDNVLPPGDAIRVEEFINYFDYDLPEPRKGEAYSVETEFVENPWNDNIGLMRISLQGREFPNNRVEGNNLVFLLDVSGSMSSANKLGLVKKSLRLLVKELDDNDKVAIVVYAGSAGCVLESTNNKDEMRNALGKLNAGGSTAGGAGIHLAYNIAEENFIEGGNNRIILATDGDFNVGVSGPNDLEKLIESKRDKGIGITVLGFGIGNYKDQSLEIIANKGNGNYFYIDNIRESEKVFKHDLVGTLFTIAKDVKIQVEFNPAYVHSYRLVGYENRLLEKGDFNDDTKDAGEMGAGHQVTALYEIVKTDMKDNWKPPVDALKYQHKKKKLELSENGELCTVKLRYKKPDEDESNYNDLVVSEKIIPFEKSSDNTRLSASIAAWAMILKDSKFVESMNIDDILETLNSLKSTDEFGYRAELVQLVNTSSLLLENDIGLKE